MVLAAEKLGVLLHHYGSSSSMRHAMLRRNDGVERSLLTSENPLLAALQLRV